MNGLQEQLALVRARVDGIVELAHQSAQRGVELARGEERRRAHDERRGGQEQKQALHHAAAVGHNVAFRVDRHIFHARHKTGRLAHDYARAGDMTRVFAFGQRVEKRFLRACVRERLAVEQKKSDAVRNC